MRTRQAMGPAFFCLAIVGAYVAFIAGSGRTQSLQDMSAQSFAAKPLMDTDTLLMSEPKIHLLDTSPSIDVATDALIRPGLEIEDGSAYLNATR